MSDNTRHEVEDRTEGGLAGLQELPGSIDVSAFAQILCMDDDEDEHEFSQSIVLAFFEQAKQTFTKMDNAVAGDLAELSSLGHLLKSSSATLGLTKIKDNCRNIQYYGLKKDETGVVDEPDDDKCLSRIKDSLMAVKGECDKVQNALQKFFAG